MMSPTTFRPSLRLGLASLTLSALVASAAPARGNGRFPRAMRLTESLADPSELAVYGTYGLLLTRDAGQHWYHVCESATGPFNGEAAMLEGLADGRLLIGTDTDLMRSEDQACGWSPVLTPGATALLEDVSRSVASDEIYVLLNNLASDIGLYVTVERSEDEADTFSPFADLPREMIERAFTLDVAPSDPDRIYVSGVSPDGIGVVLRMSDQGQTVEAFELPLGSASAAPYIAAVHPSDPDTLFVRTDELALIDNSTTAKDRLLLSRDGAETWTQIIERRAKLLGFALSPDDETVLAGYGDPVLFAFDVAVEDVGIYRFDLDTLTTFAGTNAVAAGADADAGGSADAGSSVDAPLEKIHDRSTTCLRWTTDTLYGCFTQQQVGFEVAVVSGETGSRAAELDWTPLLDLSEVRPLQCAEDSATAQCIDDIIYGWPVACAKLGAPCDLTGPANDAGGTTDTASSEGSGCNCRVAAAHAPTTVGSKWALVAASLGWVGGFVLRRALARRRRLSSRGRSLRGYWVIGR